MKVLHGVIAWLAVVVVFRLYTLWQAHGWYDPEYRKCLEKSRSRKYKDGRYA